LKNNRSSAKKKFRGPSQTHKRRAFVHIFTAQKIRPSELQE